jgi:hypothetical protein
MDEAPKSNRRTIIIVVVIAVILLCCCCPVIGYGLYWLWQNGDSLLGNLGQVLPLALTAL